MQKKRIFLTGATGSMGFMGMQALLKDSEKQDLIILARPSEKNKVMLTPFTNVQGLKIEWGDLNNYEDVFRCVEQSDIILHVGALVSPEADYYPEQTMKVNYGSTMNIISAIKEQNRENEVRLVYIGTVAQTGDRMPPIHWGRVGDPLKPSVFDYYAVSKIASERAVIESGLKYWVSLRQTGILSSKMSRTEDAIMFHNCLDNVLEYVSDRDSAVLLRNICKELPDDFWQHVYNIGGGENCRVSGFDMYEQLFKRIGIKKMSHIFDSKWFAIRNFHGQYYLDSDKLENYLHFRSGGMEYFYELYLKQIGLQASLSRIICKLPGGSKMVGSVVKKRFLKLARAEHGPLRFIEENIEEKISAYFISREEWEKIPDIDEMQHFSDWDSVTMIKHGYDETLPENCLSLCDVNEAAVFRGGKCLSPKMKTGDWQTKLMFACAFGHEFEISPRAALHAGHWCPVCERESWNFHETAKVNPYFAQVWYPLHDENETVHTYPKAVSELDVTYGRQC